MGIMSELETLLEQKLIDQLVYGDSQWTYRSDLKTEEDLWKNFKYILEQNNKDRLNGEMLSDSEFEQVEYSGVAEPYFPLKKPPIIPMGRANLSANKSQ